MHVLEHFYIVMKRGRAVNGTELIALKNGDLRIGDKIKKLRGGNRGFKIGFLK